MTRPMTDKLAEAVERVGDRAALDFCTDMTRARAVTLRLGVICRRPGGWDYAWQRDRLEPDELALCNLETWPELGGDLRPFLQQVIEDFAAHGYAGSRWSGARSALHLVRLSEPLAALAPPREGDKTSSPSALVDLAWRDLLEKDDRTSPAEYPEMVLITHDELAEIIFASALSSAKPRVAEGSRDEPTTSTLIEALKPFADIADEYEPDGPRDTRIGDDWEGSEVLYGRDKPTLGDFRRARDLLKTLEGSE